MAPENGMDIKTLSAMIGHVSAETTLNIYSHITDTMQQQAARIDREIAGADTPIPEPTATDKASDSEATDQPTEPKFEPYKGKIRKPGTGCVTMINDHLYEGRFSPRVNGKRIAKNIYIDKGNGKKRPLGTQKSFWRNTRQTSSSTKRRKRLLTKWA